MGEPYSCGFDLRPSNTMQRTATVRASDLRLPKIRPSPRQLPEVRVTGVVIVGTGFGCITHLRALRAAGFDVRALDAIRRSHRERAWVEIEP
jgi:hypothetical protein